LGDSRPQVKLSVLKDLKYLGEKGGHLWEANHIAVLINSIVRGKHLDDQMETDDDNDCPKQQPIDAEIEHATLDVINSVTSSSAILNFIYSAGMKHF
jgi:hypothetical protein